MHFLPIVDMSVFFSPHLFLYSQIILLLSICSFGQANADRETASLTTTQRKTPFELYIENARGQAPHAADNATSFTN